MKKVLAISLALALAFPAAGLMAQQQQAPAKVQPVQTAYYQGVEGGIMGLSMSAAIAVAVAVAIAVAAANDSSDSFTPTATATGTR